METGDGMLLLLLWMIVEGATRFWVVVPKTVVSF